MSSLATTLPRFEIPSPEVRAEIDRRARENERDETLRQYSQRLTKAGIPPRYQNAQLSDCDPTVQAWVRAALYGKEAGHDLLLAGSVGRGKTHQACACLRALCQSYSCLFTTADTIIRDVQDTYGNGERESDVFARYASVQFLVIDDFGKRAPSKDVLRTMFALIDRRYSFIRPTIYTTQYHAGQLLERLSLPDDSETALAIMSRLQGAVSVWLDGNDRRLNA